MRYGFTEDQERFRADVRKALRSAEVRAAVAEATASDGVEPDQRPLYRLLGGLGLLAVHWPAEFGGAGRAAHRRRDRRRGTGARGRPGHPARQHHPDRRPVPADGGRRRAETPPPARLARGERFASVLYTEPGRRVRPRRALRTVAEPDGDGYRIAGTKVFSLKTRFVDHGLCAARTTPGTGKYQGISLVPGRPGRPRRDGVGDPRRQRRAVPPRSTSTRCRSPGPTSSGRATRAGRCSTRRWPSNAPASTTPLKAEHWLEAALEALPTATPALPRTDRPLGRRAGRRPRPGLGGPHRTRGRPGRSGRRRRREVSQQRTRPEHRALGRRPPRPSAAG